MLLRQSMGEEEMSASEYYEQELEKITMSELKDKKIFPYTKKEHDIEHQAYSMHACQFCFNEDMQKVMPLQKELSVRETAAIKLKVPESGTPWLDEMIENSLRNDFAKAAMHAMINRGSHVEAVSDNVDLWIANEAYKSADALLAESKKKKEEV